MLPFDLRRMVFQTVVAPQEVARALITWNPPNEARWIGVALVAVASVILGTIGEGMVTVLSRGAMPFTNMAFTLGPMQFVMPVVIAFLMAFMGRRFGGTGNFRDALLLSAWMQGVMTVIQAIQIVVMIFFPMTALVALSFAIIALLMHLLVNFTAALHGFTNLISVAAGVVFTAILVIFLTALILGAFLSSAGFVPVDALPS